MKISSVVAREIATYITATKKSTQTYSKGERQAMLTFLAELDRSDGRQAELVLQGYRLCGGRDESMIVIAARAIQMTHTYAAMIAAGQSNISALSGLHAAEIVLANVVSPDEFRLKAVSITNRALLLFMHAQTVDDLQSDQAQHYLATESALNPLHVGMVLAGADCAETDKITAFALALGHFWNTGDDKQRQLALSELANLTLWPAEKIDNLRKLL